MSLTIKDIHKSISLNIIRIRRERVLTQQDLANQMQCSQAFINQIETGSRDCNIEQIYKIATILNCSVYDIIPDYKITWTEE